MNDNAYFPKNYVLPTPVPPTYSFCNEVLYKVDKGMYTDII
jgi:hypothetical protein